MKASNLLTRSSVEELRFHTTLLSAFLFFTYIKLHLWIPGLGIPYFFAHVAGLIFLISTNRLANVLGLMGPWVIFLVFQFYITSDSGIFPSKSDVQYFLYNILTLISVVAFYMMLRALPAATIEKIARVFLYIILIVCFVEVYGGAKEIFDSIRAAYTSEFSMYTAEERDLLQYGATRPSAFTSEPSSVGNFFGAILLIYLFSNRCRWSKIVECALLFACAVQIVRSPTLPIYLMISTLLWVVIFGRPMSALLARSLAFVAFSFLTVGPYLLYHHWDGSRIGFSAADEFLRTGSFYIRQVAPVDTFLAMLAGDPFFGFGYSYFEKIKDLNWVALSIMNPGFYDYDRLTDMSGGQFVTNATWEFFLLNGMLGSIIVLIYLGWLSRTMGIKNRFLVLVCVGSAWVAHAGVSLLFTWVPVIAVAYALSIFSGRPSDTRI